jgi:hypothetical protein
MKPIGRRITVGFLVHQSQKKGIATRIDMSLAVLV